MRKFDGLALIDAVTDLSELLGRRSRIQEFLSDLVGTVAEHLAADVCSLYLYDVELELLVLRATTGLNASLVGTVRLAPGEGLTGYAFQHNRPILESNATTSALNKAIPDLGEEEYPSFIGVPIKRNDLGIGVLTLQYEDPARLDAQVTRALRAIASHLAATLENAAALYEAHDEERLLPAGIEGTFETGMMNGTSASRGIAIGPLEYLDARRDHAPRAVRRSLDEAIEMSAAQLQELQRRVDTTLSDVAAMIFSSHLLMLRDDSFVGPMLELVTAGSGPVAAVQTVVERFCTRFSAIPDPRFQEKAQDVQDLGNRIIHNIEGSEAEEGDYQGHIVAAQEIFPSELVKLYLQNVAGLVFSGGSATGHVAILAQSLELPVVATADPRLFAIPSGTEVVVDAEDGKIVVGPSGEIRNAYRARIAIPIDREQIPEKLLSPEIRTEDGVAIILLANVNLVKDARHARRMGAHGIGLYRSEFPFLIRNGFPTEEEQITVYQRVIEAMPGKPVYLRTLDLGGDKLLSTQVGREDNPFLGFRGIRFLLGHREILRDQLRAMLQAGYEAELGIQFPMVSSVEEFVAAREEVHRCIAELTREGLPCNINPALGVMVELPAAVEIAPELAATADFLSIGTNDLIMYMLAADRTNHRVAELYRAIHPAVLRALKRIQEAAAAAATPLSVCGATAADPAMVLFYLGIGITRLSVDSEQLIRVASFIQSVTLQEAQETAGAMLADSSLDSLLERARRIRKEAVSPERGVGGQRNGEAFRDT